MKFFVDTADVNEIRDLAETGLLDGVTTNPSLVAKSGAKEFKRFARLLKALFPLKWPRPISKPCWPKAVTLPR
jgi:hypothetical protein